MSATRAKKKIGSFEVAEELAQGGMGIVYLAEQPSLKRRVVLKTLRRDMASDKRVVERFRREAQAPAAVHHQNVVAVYDCFEWRNEIYIAQEYVEGADLASVVQALQRLDPRVAAMIALEVTRGLEEIHESGIVHRDLKPANILVSASGETKVADFGIALDTRGKALTRVGHAVGTPLYMSPEQLLGEKAEPRSDLYSLGVVLYEMITGRTPFLDDDSEEGEALLRQIEAGRYPPLRKLVSEAPRALGRIARTCLQPKPRKIHLCSLRFCSTLSLTTTILSACGLSWKMEPGCSSARLTRMPCLRARCGNRIISI